MIQRQSDVGSSNRIGLTFGQVTNFEKNQLLRSDGQCTPYACKSGRGVSSGRTASRATTWHSEEAIVRSDAVSCARTMYSFCSLTEGPNNNEVRRLPATGGRLIGADEEGTSPARSGKLQKGEEY